MTSVAALWFSCIDKESIGKTCSCGCPLALSCYDIDYRSSLWAPVTNRSTFLGSICHLGMRKVSVLLPGLSIHVMRRSTFRMC